MLFFDRYSSLASFLLKEIVFLYSLITVQSEFINGIGTGRNILF